MKLHVVASGICCALGYSAKAVDCALRAGMDHFQESEFVTDNGQPVRVARLPDNDAWGAHRLSQWMAHAVNDCLSEAGALKDPALMVVMLSAEPGRPGFDERSAVQAAVLSNKLLGVSLSPKSTGWQGGRAGLANVLQQTQELLQQGQCQQVLLLGFDSFLNAQTINHYLQTERLLVSDNRDGFIPGEAAAAVLLQLAHPDTPGLHIAGWGQGEEPGRPDGSVPSRAMGLSQAIRGAFKHAGINCNDLAFRLSDQNGEGFFAGEAANAITRVAEEGGTVPMVQTTADCVGEVGAATGVLMLAWLHHLLPRADGPGECGLIHLANDEGLRCAVVVQHVA